MGSIVRLSFLWLSLTTCPLVHCETSSNYTHLEAVMAQLVEQQKAMAVTLEATKARLEATEAKLEATESRLEATEAKLEATETRLEATEAKLEATETRLEATEAKLEATETRLETKLEATETKLKATKTRLEATEARLEATETNLEATMANVQNTRAERGAPMANGSTGFKPGSSFIRWGRRSCPINTILVYAGAAGGKLHDHKGSGTNPLCLTKTPQFDSTKIPSHYGYLYGAEYETIPGHEDHNVPCAVCLAPQSTTIMVPGTLTCPSGWTPQYNGHLVSQLATHYATEYLCLDGSPEHETNDERNENGLLFYYVITVCGSLPCAPYINNRVVTCVVCSK